MSSFIFNFAGDNNESETSDTKKTIWYESNEVIPKKQIEGWDEMIKYAKIFMCRDVTIGHITNIKLDETLGKDVNFAERCHSDLIPGKYEGGLKLWECTYDLVEYLEEHSEISFDGAKVLDLGCGIGILGIYSLLKGAKVTFQDYNKEIIENVTVPNVLLNTEEEDTEYSIDMCKFYSGDWESFNEKLEDNFDIILTSETIYNVDNYEKLVRLFENRISDNGIVLVAAKTCYFGVGGSVRQFEKAVSDSNLSCEVVWKNDSGIQREILKICKRS
ncbi:histidine protein methyltransferase 1 homolog [Aricia agestis]|uniref:histidine protein methyltransferase 1 homolog n=1 Tax=Aricia agestis TaxID=91739 RepID=UPI001C20AC1A|nr:histidine protein methyltransferase 1 homolog [Aricia agestis]